MNDPGFHEPIESDANDVENQKGEEQSGKEENEQAFLDPSRWWFASTAFPLIAGTFGPMGSAFSICALVVPWRVYIPPGGAAEQNGTYVPDPKWLIGINAAQLVIALFSNLFLLLNMAKRVRFSIAQPITIIGWYISSFVLIILCSLTSGPLVLRPRERYAFTGAFYFGIFSAGLYFLVASLMLITVWGASKGHYAKEFQLTMSQRTLMLQTISFLVYLLSGAAVYSRIEGWAYLDAVYWADYTLLTIGIGDFSPTTHTGRALLFPFAIGGIIILGLVIGSIRSLVLERGKVKLGARMVENERRRLIARINKKERPEILEPVHEGNAQIPRASTKKIEKKAIEMTELHRREQEFNLMRRIQKEAATRRGWSSLIISGTTWFILWFAGAAIFKASEHNQNWTYFGSLYFAYTSLLTIGYGDFYPQSNSGKAFFVFWSLLAIPSLTILISNMGDTIIKGIRDLTLWIGKLTVLPGEKGEKGIIGMIKGLKESMGKTANGKVFSNRREPAPLTTMKKEIESEERRGSSASTTQLKGTAQLKGKLQEVDMQHTDPVAYRKQAEKDILKSKIHYHHYIIREISDVITHLNASPAKQYSYEEWAWYLKLIGEDESEATTHRRAVRMPKADGKDVIVGEMTEGEERDPEKKRVNWSWIDNRSPLMGEKSEAEWVLERLTRKLQRELERVVREQGEEKGLEKEGEEEGAQKEDGEQQEDVRKGSSEEREGRESRDENPKKESEKEKRRKKSVDDMARDVEE